MQLATKALNDNSNLQDVPRPAGIVAAAWRGAALFYVLIVAAVVGCRAMGYIECAFLCGIVGAAIVTALVWLSLRSLFPAATIPRALITLGFALSSAVLAAGYTGLFIDAAAAEGGHWAALVKFGEPDYAILGFGCIMFFGVLATGAIFHIKSGYFSQPTAAP